ncbi:polyphosphate kinase 2 family protein [Antarcticibacterium flavum]|uniref:Polyphosphate kinase 2 family protein n=1 Tax=Antarcticibacterium flavum TaxID=2058175 RepID=A0A5B7X2A5_9FLAO|nr:MULTISPECIES: PPK2 family polyphosphate kinase [Antarcticibacterium]MCM4160756.1 phosphate--nucleotide phosphotransferase [Antarcticibacterium sp. W02-3]QCY68768.1 polyphosphate kinase 2 family protein [Antarcticibacterium flavum]
MKNIDHNQFRVTSPINVKELGTSIDMEADEKEIKKHLKETRKKLADWQDTLYAHKKYSVLFCIQGMDTSGKDSLIREVFKGFNSRGVVVHSFKVPSSKELKHDYLWRHYIALPERGKFGVFNRTHYENVLVTRVHPEYILKENLPQVKNLDDIDDEFWERRFNQIRNFEKHLEENGTIIFKFFLNISKEEQRQRLLRRLRKPNKNWKFSPGDLEERKLWSKYREYYQDAINRTSSEKAPWYIIPADDKATARYLVAKVLWEELSKYNDVKEPELPADIRHNLEDYKEQLQKEH